MSRAPVTSEDLPSQAASQAMCTHEGAPRGHKCGDLGGWATATDRQKGAWLLRIATICKSRHCSSFKSRPSSQCPVCGNDPVPVGMDPWTYDRGNGWDWN